MDVWEYFASKEREFQDLSLGRDDNFLFAGLEGSNGTRGRVWGRLILNEGAFLTIDEKVVVEGSGIHREEYSYFLIIDGAEVWGYERDPAHDPPEHGHGVEHTRHAAGRVTFKDVAQRAWETISAEEQFPPPDDAVS